jgi:hypothetical protein
VSTKIRGTEGRGGRRQRLSRGGCDPSGAHQSRGFDQEHRHPLLPGRLLHDRGYIGRFPPGVAPDTALRRSGCLPGVLRPAGDRILLARARIAGSKALGSHSYDFWPCWARLDFRDAAQFVHSVVDSFEGGAHPLSDYAGIVEATPDVTRTTLLSDHPTNRGRAAAVFIPLLSR